MLPSADAAAFDLLRPLMDVFPIRTDEDHARALRRIEQLWNAKPNSPEEAELDILATLVDAYEEKRWELGGHDTYSSNWKFP